VWGGHLCNDSRLGNNGQEGTGKSLPKGDRGGENERKKVRNGVPLYMQVTPRDTGRLKLVNG